MGRAGAFAVVGHTPHISEENARSVLADDGVPGADTEHYEALRVSGGWLFRWRDDGRPGAEIPRTGIAGWVVADNGRYRGQPLWTTADEVARSLLEGRPLARPWD